MTISWEHLATAFAVLALSESAVAQAGGASTDSGTAVAVGSRVRVFAPTLRRDRFVGRIDTLDATRMVLDTAGARQRFGFEMGPVLVDTYRRVGIQRSAVERIEISGGRAVRRSAVRGMFWGALIGALVVGVGNLPQVNAGFDDFAKYAPVGAALGGAAGFVVGYALGGERWLPARLPSG
ncbi:MAG: hypothetical protein ACT4R6_01110 [Gemmatimonadaceae bacterium]